ncbi:endo-1,4-beta-xylanase 5 isoform X3 [Brassica rapa]|uniref:endo-1,4-beta-xylanase 5 isoform X3 n=1 Tax=Brassica campestris TaxID=3711 RepID=UPI0004F14F13|nr:endo-1,4-beta-xylanase 5 isoform X3 [Brassica rapa]
MKRLLLQLLALWSFSLSSFFFFGCESTFVPYDYSATVECLDKPLKPQYNGGIIVNPDLRDGPQAWLPFGNAKIEFKDIGHDKFVVARERKQPHDSVSQKVHLEKGRLYTFSAWLQVNNGKAPVSAVFKTNGEYKHAGSVIAESKCWSMLKGGLTVDESGPGELYFESNDTRVEIWVDSVSLQPFTQEEWKSHQDHNIHKERKRTVRIRVVNSKGEPVQKASLSIEQRKLGFPFGCEVEKNILGNHAYQSWFTKRFTVTTFANEMKWYSTEVVRGKEDYSIADKMFRFFKKHGVAVRGHNIVWSDPKYQTKWLNSLSGREFYNAVKQRVSSVASRYKGQLEGWDVVNENLHFSYFEKKMGPKASRNIFKMAQAFDPTTTKFINEYNTLEEPRDLDSSPAKFLKKLRELKSIVVRGNISLGIGLESHFKTPNIPFMRSALDILGATDLPIWLTEVDVEAPKNVQAKYFEQVLREGHAHPRVKGIVTWAGYSPTGCYRMCLTDGNFKNLPTGDVVDKLLHEWGGFRRQTKGLTDADGFFEASLFHGDYDFKIDHPLTNSKASHSFKLVSDVSSNTQPSSFVFRL